MLRVADVVLAFVVTGFIAQLASVPHAQAVKGPQVAIIGAGIGGAATAHYIRELVGSNVAIHVYEQFRVGGRLRSSVTFEGHTHELGGSMVYEENYHVRALVDDAGLQRVNPLDESNIGNLPFSLFDGSSFVFNQSSWSLVTLARMLLRYGTAPARFQGKPRGVFELFRTIYDLQANGTSFDTPEALLKRVKLFGLTQQSMSSHVKDILGTDEHSRRFASEFIAAVNRVNYNQDNTLNALAGMVSMLPAMDPRVFKIKGGNEQLPQRLLQGAGVHLKRGWSVEEVRSAKGCRFELHAKYRGHRSGDSLASKKMPWEQVVSGPYEAVVVATPLEHSHLRFYGVNVRRPPMRTFQRVVTTFVVGCLRASYFGTTQLPTDQVLTSEGASTHFSVVSPLRRLRDGRTLYKMFSHDRLGDGLIRAMFDNATEVDAHDWYAYPMLSPPEAFAPFQLARGIYYNNAIESAASAMEMSAIAAKNSALLVAQHLARNAGRDMVYGEE